MVYIVELVMRLYAGGASQGSQRYLLGSASRKREPFLRSSRRQQPANIGQVIPLSARNSMPVPVADQEFCVINIDWYDDYEFKITLFEF